MIKTIKRAALTLVIMLMFAANAQADVTLTAARAGAKDTKGRIRVV